jgi:DNA-binding NarL/FixJ family response regulator
VLSAAELPFPGLARVAEMSASGETTKRDGPAGERLTPQELQIALLVTQGQTNAEIGRAVFLSTRTVEFHLSRAYRKLGISSRAGLAGRLAGMGQAPGGIPVAKQNQ